jgi:uncharacterized protein (TIGR00299 family) protein
MIAIVRIDVETVRRGAFTATRLVVHLPHEHARRGLADLVTIIDSAPSLSDRMKSRAKEAFARLAEAEAKVHGTSVEDVHFHEVGALDAIVDVVGFFACAELLGVEAFHYTNLVLGAGGVIHGAHGECRSPLPLPSSSSAATVAYSTRAEELMTPTAAAIIASAFTPLAGDARVVQGRVGYGAGTRDAGNAERARVARPAAAGSAREVAIIRCTIDNMNPELYGNVMQRAFENGALEVYYTPVFMKKNRPGVEITVISETHDVERLSHLLLTHTTTLGLRVPRARTASNWNKCRDDRNAARSRASRLPCSRRHGE